MSESVSLTVDGKEVSVPKGTNVLEAVRKASGEISFFCYHPGLSVVAVCRQCLVEIKGQPKLVPACQAIVAPGMEVFNSNDRVLEARRSMLEFTLVNHPIDCPICDKAGECILQRQYMEWDHSAARGADLLKIHKPKRVDVGPHIVLDAERCILCTRCIRVCDEVAGVHELEMAWRGAHEELSTAPGRLLENPYSLNTVDVCPVGALTSKDFRFKRRVWELSMTPSVCTGCATGCNDEIHHADGQVYRLVPRENADVNKYWMCDDGRLGYRELYENRILRARVNGKAASLDAALDAAANLIETNRPNIGFVLSAWATSEDNYVAQKIAFEGLGVGSVTVAGRAPWQGDAILRNADRNPNRRGAELCARGCDQAADSTVKTWYVMDSDFVAKGATENLIVAAWRESPLTQRAQVVLPASAWAEVDGTITNARGLVQRLRKAVDPPGDARPHHELLALLGRRLGVACELRQAKTIFQEMRAAIPEFASADFGRDFAPMLLRFADSRG